MFFSSFAQCSRQFNLENFRVGLTRHAVKSWLAQSGPEKGYDLNACVLSNHLSKLEKIGAPKALLGLSANCRGSTSTAFIELAWDYSVKKAGEKIFFEVGLGGGVHNGETKNTRNPKKLALGSRLLFREHVGLGYRVSEDKSIVFQLDHMSNARLAKPNPGLTSFGLFLECRF
jgi:lipid A 3-O-deacylase